MLNSKIFRNIQIHLDKVLKKYDLSSGSCPYLFILEKNEGISQSQISKEVGNDKAMSTRTITKLIEKGYILKVQDKNDSRAYKLYLTQKCKQVMPSIHGEIQSMTKFVTKDLEEDEREVTLKSMKKILNIIQSIKG